MVIMCVSEPGIESVMYDVLVTFKDLWSCWYRSPGVTWGRNNIMEA